MCDVRGILYSAMDQKATFIPRKNVTDASVGSSNQVSTLGLVAIALFIVTAIGAGGIFGYTRLIDKQINERQEALNKAEQEIRSPAVQELKTEAARLEIVEERLNGHLMASVLFKKIGDITLKNIRWKNLRFDNKQGEVTISLDGESRTLASVALQADKLVSDPFFVNPQVSNVTIGKDNKSTFVFRAQIKSGELNFAAIENKKAQGVAPEDFGGSSQGDINQDTTN